MRTILQSEASECGLACLAMIAGHHGYNIDLFSLRKKFSVSLKGLSLESLIRHAAALDFSARAVRVEPSDLNGIRLPCILHWNLDHFVVLTEVRSSVLGVARFTVIDPAIGERRLNEDEVSRAFTGVVLELAPTPAFRRVKELRSISISDLAGKVVGLRKAVVQLIVLACALELLAALGPFFNQIVIDDIVVTGDYRLLTLLMWCFSLLLVTQTGISLFRSWILLRWSAEVNIQWTARMLNHLVRLPLDFFEKRHLGDVVSRFGAIGTIQTTLSALFLESSLDAVMVLFAGVLMFTYSVPLASVTCASVALYLLLRALFYHQFRNANEERLILAAREQSFFLETIRGIVPLKLFGFEQPRLHAWQSMKTAVTDRDLRTQHLEILFKSFASTISAGKGLLILFLGAGAVIDGVLSVGMLMAFIGYSTLFSARANNLADLWIRLRMLTLHVDRLADIALEEREYVDQMDTDVSRISPVITLRGIRHRYADGEPWVIDGVSVEIGPNETVALVGKSGSGKTTLFKIMLGLIKPTEGDVLIDGIGIDRLGLRAYRQLIGTVMQDDILLAGSIAENICFFSATPDQEQIVESAKMAAVHKEICALPMGYETLVGDMGSVLSSGQKQRIMLARALYRKPKILALDEGTSNLDVGNEKKVNHAIASLSLTRIIIAHRPDTIKSADRLLLLSNGGIRECLTKETSLSQEGAVDA